MIGSSLRPFAIPWRSLQFDFEISRSINRKERKAESQRAAKTSQLLRGVVYQFMNVAENQ